MVARGLDRSAADFIPAGRLSLPKLEKAVDGCRGCDLYKHATQGVFGEGPRSAKVLMIGEQPGDQEDLVGKPFVGPAGRVLHEALMEAGIDRKLVYVTNAVKHFKWEPRGNRRLHSKPSAREVQACRPWLEHEIALIQPEVVVCMGATASQSLLGNAFRLTQHRAEFIEGTGWADAVLATIHPSSILRMPDREKRQEARREFVRDLVLVRERIGA
jgi:uracil-DNA glycosylase family protein